MVWGWQYERYLIPVLPLLLWSLASALGRWAKVILSIMLILQMCLQVIPRLGHPSPWAKPATNQTYDWLSQRPTPAILASAQPVRDGWYARMPSIGLPLAQNPREFARVLSMRRTNYILRIGGQDYGLDSDPEATIRQDLERAYHYLEDETYFRKVFINASEQTIVYEPR
jgi:hypothetical protein